MFGFDIVHLIIAYGGLLLHVLLKLAELPGSLLSGFDKNMTLVTIASIIAIPIILLICSDTAMSELLPITNITAFLAGYQTQSFLRTISDIGGRFREKNIYI